MPERDEPVDPPVQLVAYDASWPARFTSERAILAPVLALWLGGPIEHVGSTAIPGLAAKPVIDIMAAVDTLSASIAAIPSLAQLGYLYAPYKVGMLPAGLAGMDAIELGCGTVYVSAWLARRGTRVVGIDNSEVQLATARRLQREHGIEFPLLHGNSEAVPWLCPAIRWRAGHRSLRELPPLRDPAQAGDLRRDHRAATLRREPPDVPDQQRQPRVRHVELHRRRPGQRRAPTAAGGCACWLRSRRGRWSRRS